MVRDLRVRRWPARPVNPEIREPRSPGPWVDDVRCLVCGARYERHRAGVDWTDAVQRLRAAARAEGDAGGGFRSRRPVLWTLRTLKLESWYQAHYACGWGWDVARRAPYPVEDRAAARARLPAVVELEVDGPPSEVWVRGHHDDDGQVLEAARLWLDEIGCAPVRLRIGALTYARWCWGRAPTGELVPNAWRAPVPRARGAIAVTQVEVS